MEQQFAAAMQSKSAVIGVIGLGYVGLPLLLEFGKSGYTILGFDTDHAKVETLKKGESYIREIDHTNVASVFSEKGHADATSNFSRISECSALLICVPTPLDEHREPDLTFVRKTARAMAPSLRKGQLIVLESTTYPGTTEEVLAPILEEGSGLEAGSDFMLAYSPEREDPGNKEYKTSSIPKVVGGLNEACLNAARALYSGVVPRTVPVSSCRTAEATKLMENIFRCVNIALVNELKMVFSGMGIDIWEVINAADTKPFGYMPFYPGPGLGGHCIPIDPFYLTWKAREHGIPTRFIELAGEVNTGMPEWVLHKVQDCLNSERKAVNGSRILVLGVAYKPNVDDMRESPSLVLMKRLMEKGAHVDYHDPYIDRIPGTRAHPELAGKECQSVNSDYDCFLLTTAHDEYKSMNLLSYGVPIVDTRNVLPDAAGVFRA